MTDDTDNNLNIDTSNGTALEPAFAEYIDSTHTANDLLTNPTYDPTNTKNQSIGQILLSSAKGAISSAKRAGGGNYLYKGDTSGFGDYGFDRQATVGNFEQGRERVSLEGTKPPYPKRALQSEDPQQVYERWYRNMKQFAYSGK